jgi:Family of unknown function (DUF6364)
MTHPTKLTLRLDSGLIESAKVFAHENQRSLSQLVADYFARLGASSVSTVSGKTNALTEPGASKPLSPLTASLRGSWAAAPSRKKGQTKPVNVDDYRAYLEEKHR